MLSVNGSGTKAPRSHAIGSGAALIALLFAASCAPAPETEEPGGTGGTSVEVGGRGGSSSSGSGGKPSTGSGGSGGSSSSGTGGSTPSGSGGSTSGSTGGSSGSQGGSAGSGTADAAPAEAGGGNVDTPNVPVVGVCTTPPAATAPGLKKTAITSLPGGVQAGQVVGVPGETRIYIVGHKNGQIYTVDGTGAAAPMEGAKVSVATGGNNEQGLLSMAFHPANKNTFYLYYTAGGTGAPTIDEFERMTPTTAMLKGKVHSHTGSNRFHNGGSIYFNPKDATPFLYLSVGDAQNAGNASPPMGTNGRILKVDLATKMTSTLHYNIRNPYRMSIDRGTGDMWIGNVSNPPGGQIYYAAASKTGENFGWDATNNAINGGRDSSGNAIIGGVVYRGSKIKDLCGRYFFGQHNSGGVKSLIQSGGMRMGEVATHASLNSGGLSSFGEDGAGEIYISTLGGAVSRIDPM